MQFICAALCSFWQDEGGATAIEYGLIAALVSVAVIGGAAALGVNITALFAGLANCIANPGTGCMATAGG